MREVWQGKGWSLQAEQLEVRIGKKRILEEVSFCLEPGLAVLLGENGAGKTTLLKSILHLGTGQSGKVLLRSDEGKKICLTGLSSRERAKYLSYVPQELQTPVHCRVKEFAAMGRTPYLGWLQSPGPEEEQMALQALEELQVRFLADRFMDRISGGEKRMACLARARVQGAGWMILDEPAASLDFGRGHRFFSALRKYLKKSGTGALVSIHDPLLAYTYGDQILVLEKGRIRKTLNRKEKTFEKEYAEQIKNLYGVEAVFTDTPAGRTVIWRDREDAED